MAESWNAVVMDVIHYRSEPSLVDERQWFSLNEIKNVRVGSFTRQPVEYMCKLICFFFN